LQQAKQSNHFGRGRSAFLFFTQTKRSELQAANPTMKNTEVSRLLGDMWRKMTPEEKAPHLEFEMKARGDYQVALAEWKKQVQEQHDAQKDVKQPEDQRVDDSPWRYDPHALNTSTTPTAGMMLNNYLMQQTFGIYGTSGTLHVYFLLFVLNVCIFHITSRAVQCGGCARAAIPYHGPHAATVLASHWPTGGVGTLWSAIATEPTTSLFPVPAAADDVRR
jgi:hypothetical protein